MTCFPVIIKSSSKLLVLIIALGVGCKERQNAVRDLDGLQVPEGFSIERAVDPALLSYPMFASFDEQGRLFVFESDGSQPSNEEMIKNPPYHVRLLEDTDEDGIFDKSTIFADSLSYPKGGVFYNGSLYVTSSPDFLRLSDTDGDGVAEEREVLITGWVLNRNGALLGGPFLGPDGWMYLTDARRGFDITSKEGKKFKGSSARIWRCRPDGTGLEAMSGGGYDNAIEIVFMPSGETVGTMTYFIEPQGGMRDAIMHWVEGGVYPKSEPVIEKDRFKLTGDLMPVMTKMARVAPSGLIRYRGSAFGEEYTDNIFTAEFNTGRIMRFQVTRDGATYQTIDEPFVTSTIEDVHLTDVVEDADGSMLVLNTGGWFIAGCPLSQIAKLNVPGGIYRIRRDDARRMEDPRGKKLDIDSRSAEDLVRYVEDSRLAVRDKVIERLIEIGEPAVASIKNSILESDDEEIRAAGVFALYRINAPTSFAEVRRTLDDPSIVVRTAAARVLGLARDNESTGRLIEMVQDDALPVRRQAATALGQIGHHSAVNALLKSITDSSDRFVEHAIIYALINIEQSVPLVDALGHPSSNVRRAAIIALDQMDGSPLRKEHLVPFLASADPELRNTGIWVASHHSDWADLVVEFLQTHLSLADSSDAALEPLRNLMITFSGTREVQNFIGAQLRTSGTVRQKTLLLDVISRASVKEMPAIWIRQLGRMLQEGDPEIRSQVMGLIEARGITSLHRELNLISQNINTPAGFRLKALRSRLLSDPTLTHAEFEMVLRYLDGKNESPLRQVAARVLVSAKLNTIQLLRLAKEHVAHTDVFLLPGLVSAFDESSDRQVGEALVAALKSSPDRLESLSEQDLLALFSEYPESVRISAGPLLATLRKRNEARLAELQAVEAKLTKGDVGEGRKLFFGKAVCSTCHAVGDQGGDFGPDLTNIGEIRSQHDILEAVVYPSVSFAREYETSKITTKAITYTGVIKEQLPEAIVIATGPGQHVRIQRTEITAIEPHNISMMMPGLDKLLTPDDLSDLMAYLVSLPDGMRVMKAGTE